MRILVLGYIVRGPMGGMSWHHLQYFLGLHQMGHDVYFLEDSSDTEYACYDPERNITDADPTYGLNYASKTFKKINLDNRWAYYDYHTTSWKGPLANNVHSIISSADILLNLSCSNPIRSWFSKVPKRVLVDTDPVFTQIRNLTDPLRYQLCSQHNVFFTFGENYGKECCKIPIDGFPWQPTRQPVVLNAWPVTGGNINGNCTTVMKWDSYAGRTFKGKYYGMKSDSFTPFMDLPSKTQEKLELSISDSEAAVEKLSNNGWILSNPVEVSNDPWAYRKYIQFSKAEFGLAKEAYVVTNSGWFRERSAAYLASGKPVVVQDTGFSSFLPTGIGLFVFSSPEEAVAVFAEVNRAYEYHCKQARALIEEHFESGKVLNSLLSNI